MRKRLLPVLAVLVASAACGELPRPFQPEYKGDTFQLLPIDKAGMVVRPLDGLPADVGAAFTAAMVDALRQQDVAAMSGAGNPASLVLSGTASAETSGWSVTLALVDAHNVPLGTVASHVDPGTTGDPKSWSPYAIPLAKSVVAMLQSDPTLRPGDEPTVTIGDVAGLAGADRRTLVNALEYTLQKSRIQVAPTPETATHVIVGAVRIAPPRGPAGKEVRNVEVLWTVLRADKSEVGEVRQANDVPAGMLDQDWPDIAMAVADAAVDGIAGLVNRRPTATQ